MITDNWLDAEEWRELGEATEWCYKEAADRHGLDLGDPRHRQFIEIAYRQLIGDDCKFIDVINAVASKRAWARRMLPAMAAKSDRAATMRGYVLRAYDELQKERSSIHIGSPLVARRVARASGRDISERTVRRILKTASQR
jgi:hypothetical protein